MRQELVEHFVRLLGVNPVRGDGWVRASCPLSKWTHSSGKDSHPSFSIKVNDAGESFYNCFTCNNTGSLVELVYLYRHYAGGKGYRELIAMAENDGVVDKLDFHFDSYGKASAPATKPRIYFPLDWYAEYPKAWDVGAARRYLQSRKVSFKVASELEIRFDPYKQRVLFPGFDSSHRIVSVQGRDITGKSDLRYLSYRYQNKHNKDAMMGESLVDASFPVVVTEGPLDLASIYRVYTNVCAMIGGVSTAKLRFLQDALLLFTAFDQGTGGDTARSKVTKFFKVRPSVSVLHYMPTRKDCGDMTEKEIAKMLKFLKVRS